MSRPLRVLLVEDEALVLMMLEDIVLAAGHEVVGPASSVAQGRHLAASEAVDVALLDVNLNGQPVYPLAEDLQGAGVPFAFVTGYGVHGLEPAWRRHPTLQKPFRPEDVTRLLARTREP